MNDLNIEEAWQAAIEKVKAAPVIEAPFPHFIVENVFSDNFYAQIIAHLPDDSAYAYAGERGADGAGRHRSTIDFFKADPSKPIAGTHTPF